MKKGFLKCIAVIMVVLMTAVYMPMTDVSDLFSVEAAAATKTGSLGNNVSWKYDTSTKTITVSGSGNMKNFANGDDGQNWDSLVIGSLQYPNKHAEKIVINNGVTNIGNNAFRGLTAVKSVSIPASVTSIGTSAFEGCSALSSVNLPANLKSIGANAFKGTKFANVTIPASVTSIGDNAFANVSGLKFTCFYGDVAYNYAVKHSSSYVLKCEPVLKTVLDAANKQVKVAFEIKNTAGLNAANFTLTYTNAVKPVSTDFKVTESNGANIAVVYNETGKVSIALAATESVTVSSFAVVELVFDIVGQADTAEFSLSASTVLFNNIRVNAKPVTGSVGLHVYAEKVEKEADCKNPGTKVTECSVCGKKTETPIPVDSSKHGETEVRNQKDATCKEAGYTGDIICLDCNGVVSKGNVIGASGNHEYNKVVTDATCTAEGFTTYTCKVCGDSYQADKTPVKAHDYNAVVTEATCTAEGFTTYTCKVCGDSYQADKTPVKAHDYNIVVTAPTCTEGGFSVYTCKTCSDTSTKDITEALNHDFDANGECSRCDETIDVSISFKDAVYVVDNEAKIVYVKKTVKSGEMLADVVSGNWVVCDSEGTALAEDKQVVTCNVIKAEKSDLAYTISILGDVNCDGKVNALDARSVLRVAAQLDEKTEVFVIAGDCDGKAGISAMDARIILRVGAQMQTFA